MHVLFWIFNLLIPAIVILVGVLFTYRPPRKINTLYGYRTARSMSSAAAWEMAHALSGRIYIKLGAVLLALAVVFMLVSPLEPEATTMICMGVSVVALIAPIPYVESRLKKQFDK